MIRIRENIDIAIVMFKYGENQLYYRYPK